VRYPRSSTAIFSRLQQAGAFQKRKPLEFFIPSGSKAINLYLSTRSVTPR